VARTIPPIDLMFLLIETPDAPMHVGGVMLFDRPARARPDLVARIVQAYRAAKPLPPFDQIADFVATGMPRWRRVPSVDLDYHVHHLVLPPGATQQSFQRLIEDLHEPALDRNRPGFRVWAIEGLPEDRFAIYFKAHHSLVDGISATIRVIASLATAPRARPGAPFFAVDVGGRPPPPPILPPVAEECPYILNQCHRDLGGRKMAALSHHAPTLQIIITFRRLAWRKCQLARENGDSGWRLDAGAARMRSLPRIMRALKIVARRCIVALRDPVEHDGIEQLVPAEARFDVAAAIAPAPPFLNNPGQQPGG